MKKKLERLTGGDCYESAFRQISHFANQEIYDFSLVHGTVYSVPWEKRIGHAWIETGDIIIDATINFAGRKENYYKIGNATVDKRYTTKEALEMVVEKGTYGPWNDKNKRIEEVSK